MSARSKKQKLRVTQVRSAIGYNRRQRVILRGLGIRRMHHTVELEDTPSVRGMIRKIPHLLKVEAS
ncbi:MAG: 50S ribosomal protein L30 [Deltaproteobacteria bacterium]|nr:50S ribosomal protein L30 [Deltaproteobacteria bacterium]MDD9873464.1 50S ribosomal protein L30 [Deltaproteobacteria bacterium]